MLSAIAQEAANNVTLEGENSSSLYLVPSPSNGASVAVPASNAANVAAVSTPGIPSLSPNVGSTAIPQVIAPGTPAAQTMVGTPLFPSASQGIVLPGQVRSVP